MGYSSAYNLTLSRPDGQLFDASEIIDTLREESDGARYCLDANGEQEERGKWYDMKEDLVECSKANPGVLFEMNVVGEEFPDVWNLYVLDGKSQVATAVITYPAFNPDLLK